MARGTDPNTYLKTLKHAHKVAVRKNMLKEAAEVNARIEEVEALLSR